MTHERPGAKLAVASTWPGAKGTSNIQYSHCTLLSLFLRRRTHLGCSLLTRSIHRCRRLLVVTFAVLTKVPSLSKTGEDALTSQLRMYQNISFWTALETASLTTEGHMSSKGKCNDSMCNVKTRSDTGEDSVNVHEAKIHFCHVNYVVTFNSILAAF